MEASNFYYALKFKFATQDNNRPNFAEMIGKRAAEEMEHATMLANFQLSRGYDVKIRSIEAPQIENINNMERAIEEMINKETEITQELLSLNKFAEDGGEYNNTCNC